MSAERLGVMFLYLVISFDGMLVLGLFVYAISSWRKRERSRRHLRRKNDESRTASDHAAAAFRNRGWANTWLPGKVKSMRKRWEGQTRKRSTSSLMQGQP